MIIPLKKKWLGLLPFDNGRTKLSDILSKREAKQSAKNSPTNAESK